uniref:Cleavage and polyadenylation specificity factor subunit 7 n=1 Tax=Ornithorhynchus anatinus TaxID=9258 RepID=A0A6I8N0F0_ORNAN
MESAPSPQAPHSLPPTFWDFLPFLFPLFKSRRPNGGQPRKRLGAGHHPSGGRPGIGGGSSNLPLYCDLFSNFSPLLCPAGPPCVALVLRGRHPAPAVMSEGVDLIDIYADEEFNQPRAEKMKEDAPECPRPSESKLEKGWGTSVQDSEFSNADQIDLYDDVLAASAQPSDDRSASAEPPPPIRQEQSPKPNSKSPAILYTYSGLRNKRAAVYVGSFSWWTTDQQLIQIIRSVGVYDVVELKFAENRANGQSKGYAEVVVASENSVHKLLELLPGKILNGEKVDVRLATRQNLSQFEAQARKRVPPRAHSRDSSDSADGRATPTENLVPPPPRVLPYFNRPPSALPLMVGPPPDAYIKASAPYNHHGSRELGPPPSTVSEAEFEEIMNRNRAISSSAISKAVSGASAGDYSDAIETLLTAIAVIKQSRVANDERCRVLISSLKDCLHGIEAKSYSMGAGGSSSRKRHRSRERSPSRSRESSRRHRDLLHNEDRHEDYFQERNREHERHRDRERDRHH